MGLVSVGDWIYLAAGHLLDIYISLRLLLFSWEKSDKKRFNRVFGGGGYHCLIGSCMIIAGVLERWLKRLTPVPGMLLSFGLFILTRNVNGGQLGFERFVLCEVESWLYNNLVTAYVGFPAKDFYSTDYFSIIPWLFLFMTGYFLFRVLEKTKVAGMLERVFAYRWNGLAGIRCRFTCCTSRLFTGCLN